MSAVADLAAVNGWKLLLLALLGGHLIGKAGGALGQIVHGSPPLVAVKATMTGDAPVTAPVSVAPAAPASPPPAPKVAGVGGYQAEIEDLAEVMAAAYGPLPPEFAASLPSVSGELVVGGHPVAWAAGVLAAVAAVGLLVWRFHPGGTPTVDVHPTGPIQVAPIAPVDLNVKPDLSNIRLPDLSNVKVPDLGPLTQQGGAALGQLLSQLPGMPGGGGGAPGGNGGGGGMPSLPGLPSVPGMPAGLPAAVPAQAKAVANQLSGMLQGLVPGGAG